EGLSWLGREIGQQGHLQEAGDYLNRVLSIATYWSTAEGRMGALDAFATIHRVQGDMEQAICAWLEALDAAKATGVALHVNQVARDLAQAYRTIGQPDNALRYLDEALAADRGIQNRREEAFVLRDIAIVEADTGNYWKALERMQEAARIFHELGLSWPE